MCNTRSLQRRKEGKNVPTFLLRIFSMPAEAVHGVTRDTNLMTTTERMESPYPFSFRCPSVKVRYTVVLKAAVGPCV